MREEPAERTGVRAVERALDILLCLGGQERGLGVTEIAGRVGLSKSTAHRLLATLEARGFVQRDREQERYHLGLKAVEVAGAYLAGDDLVAAAYPEMVTLRDDVDETVSLYVREGLARIRIAKVEAKQDVRRVVQLGERLPLVVGASGKVLLAHAPLSVVAQALATLPEADRRSLQEALAAVRSDGWAASAEERQRGAAAVAAPVWNREGQVAAALALSGPTHRFTDEAVPRYRAAVVATARSISLRLGARLTPEA